jgi:SH3-like domain-containing protein
VKPVAFSLFRIPRSRLLVPLILLVLLIPGCKRHPLIKHDYMYVSAPETSLRDRVATMYNKIGTLHNGDRVDVLEKQRRFLRVRTDDGKEGWLEERSLVPQDIFDGFQKLADDNRNATVQAHGTTRAELNMHLTPARDAEHLYQLKDSEKLEILKRATAEKNPPKPASVSSAKPGSTSSAQTAAKPGTTTPAQTAPPPKPAPPPPPPPKPAPKAKSEKGHKEGRYKPLPGEPIMEDWYLVRNSAGRVGWVLLRMVDLDIPLDVAQYAEGQRIVGYFVLNTVEDQGKQVPQYLMMLNEPRDGLAWDFNQIRVFTWNRARHRYETAYRDRNLQGYLPAKTGHQQFDKEGDLPTFTIRTMNDSGQMVETTFKMNGPIVRRVLTPEEEAAEKARHAAAPVRHAPSKAAKKPPKAKTKKHH